MSLARAYQKGQVPEDPEHLLEEHLPLIRYHADQLIRRVPGSVEIGDLINAGVLGLLDGASRFDDDRNIQFKTFISYRIRGAMIDYLRTLDWFPRSMRDTAKELQQALDILEQRHGRPAEEKEVADYLNLSLKEYRDRLAQVRGVSIVYFDDLPIANGDEPVEMLEALSDDHSNVPEQHAAMFEFVEQLASAITKLPMREKVLLSLYYHEELSMKEVALILGLTESRVSQLHSQMVIRLRSLLGLDLPDAG